MYSFLHFPWHCSRLAGATRQTVDGSLSLFKFFENLEKSIARHCKFAHAGGSLFWNKTGERWDWCIIYLRIHHRLSRYLQRCAASNHLFLLGPKNGSREAPILGTPSIPSGFWAWTWCKRRICVKMNGFYIIYYIYYMLCIIYSNKLTKNHIQSILYIYISII